MAQKNLADNLEALDRLGSGKEWAKLANSSDAVLRTAGLPPPLREPVTSLQQKAHLLEKLLLLDTALKAGRTPHMAGMEVGNLPEEVRCLWDGLLGMEPLQSAVDQMSQHALDVELLNRSLAKVLGATEDAVLVTRWQKALAREALGAGHAEAAKQLLPPGSKLRDFRKVTDDTERLAAAASVGREPSLKAGLVPEGPSESFRPSVKESVAEGLPALKEEMASTVTRLRARMRETVGEQVQSHSHSIYLHLHQIHLIGDKLIKRAGQEDEERKKEEPQAAVSHTLGRQLTPSERILVARMHSRGKKPADIATVLRSLEPAEEKK
jgi:hypothetical protein